jgi:transcription elongation factor GreA
VPDIVCDVSEIELPRLLEDRQQFINARISELEFKLANADIIDPSNLPRDRVVFGSRVLLENTETGEGVEYQLVGPDESNIQEGRISVSSPLGRAIIGKRPDDEITVQAPGGKRIYELVEIL